MTIYVRRPKTYKAVLFTGTEDSYDEVRNLMNEAPYWINVDYTYTMQCQLSLDGPRPYESKGIVEVNAGEYVVLREDGKYYKFSEEDFNDWFKEA